MNTGLQNELSELRELVAALQGVLAEVKIENQLLRQKLELFIKRHFGGTKNESLDPKQLELLLAGLEALSAPAPVTDEAKPASARTTAAIRPVRQALPTHLETERVVLEPEEVQQQPEAGADWERKSPRNSTGSPRSSSSASTSGPSMPTPNASSSRRCPLG